MIPKFAWNQILTRLGNTLFYIILSSAGAAGLAGGICAGFSADSASTGPPRDDSALDLARPL